MPDRQDRLIELAAALSDGTPIDWAAAEASAATDSERIQIQRLRVVREVAESSTAATDQADSTHRLHDSLLHPSGESGEVAGDATPVMWGPLQVIEKIGRGQFGDVYRASDPRLDRDVALKLLRRRNDGDRLGSLVVDEGRLLAKIRHPGVVTVYGAERIDGRVGVWMELVRGRTLEEELSLRGPFSPAEIARVGVEVCRALAAVHRAGLVHRDVKAQNVMRDEDGRLLLMDFGTGRELEGASSFELAGTPLYLAPEVLAGAPATPQSDLYSVGVLLFHLATGKFPVVGRTLKDVRAAHARGDVVRAASCPLLSPALRAVLDRALASDPQARFARADDFVLAIEAAAPASLPAPAPPRRRRAGLWLAGLAIAAVAVATMASGGILFSRGSSLVNWLQTSTSAAGTERVLWTGPTAPGWAAVSPDGRHAAYVEEERGGNLMLRDLATGQDRALTLDADWGDKVGFAEQPVFSRDGRAIAYDWLATVGDDAHWQLRTLDLQSPTAQPTVLFEYREPGWFGPYDWSPDGARIAVAMRVGDGTSRVGWVSVADRKLTVAASADWRMSNFLAWSPDGQWLAYDAAPTADAAEPDVFLAGVSGGGIVPIRSGPGRDTVVGWSPAGELLFLAEGRGSRSIWAQPLAGGASAGRPRLVHADLRGDLLQPTSTGTLDLVVASNNQAIHTASVDLATGQSRRPSALAVSGAWPRNRQPKWSADGQYFAYMSSGHARSLSHRILSVQRVGWDQPRVLPLQLAQLWTYDWAPDNRSFLARAQSFQGKTGIYHVNAETGEVQTLMTWEGNRRQFMPQWADDGQSFYYTKAGPEAGGAIVRRSLKGGHEEVLFRHVDLRLPDGSRLPATRDSTMSPDRKYVVSYSIGPESVLWLISVADRSVRELYRVKQRNAFVHNALIWAFDSSGVIVNQASGPAGTGESRALWFVPLTGAPRKLDVGVDNLRPEAVAIHPDGAQVAFVSGDQPLYHLIRLENILADRSR